MVRFGMLTWIPLYLLKEKGLTKTDMGAAFMILNGQLFHQRSLPDELIDKFFRGKIMYLPMICMTIVFFCVFGYMNSESILPLFYSLQSLGVWSIFLNLWLQYKQWKLFLVLH